LRKFATLIFCIFGFPNGSLHAAGPDTCPQIEGGAELFRTASQLQTRFLIVGEIHGTNEIPKLFGDIVCNAAKHRPVIVTLEIAVDESEAIQSYIRSEGAIEDKKKLLSSYVWDFDFADGRSSEAIFGLIERLRKMRQFSADVEVFAVQPRTFITTNQHYFELAMANEWSKAANTNRAALVVALAGVFHARKIQSDDAGFPPAASFLPRNEVISLEPSVEGGQAWTARGQTSGIENLPDGPKVPRSIELYIGQESPFSGRYAVGAIYTASYPAKN
jgi:hypothetical protein